MTTRRLSLFLVLALVTGLVAGAGRSGPARDEAPDKDAIAKNAEGFIEAFHKGDAAAVAAFWTEDGDYTDTQGQHFKGRKEIEKAFRAYFSENKGLKLRIDSAALRFVTPEVAIEDGKTEVMDADAGAATQARYTAVHVKKDGKWYLSSVRDSVFVPRTNYEHLQQMEWLIGEWHDEVEGPEVSHMTFSWSENQGFIVNTYSATGKHLFHHSGMEWIGWDPSAKRFRSWTFDSMGGFGEGSWSRDGNKWVIKSTAVLQDGRKLAATNIVTRIDADTISWQGKDRTLDGKPHRDMKEVKMKRVK
jgi:uncharacterized protein (TIGR02246 family)